MKLLYRVVGLIIFISFSSILSCCTSKEKGYWALPDKELKQLDNAIKETPKYSAAADATADSLKRLIDMKGIDLERKFFLLHELTSFYRPRMADSSLVYAHKIYDLALQTRNTTKLNRGLLAIADAQSASGFFSAALLTYDSVSVKGESRDDHLNYWYIGRQLYSNLCSYVGEGNRLYDEYKRKEDLCRDSLIANLPEDNVLTRLLVAQIYLEQGKYKKAQDILQVNLDKVEIGDQIYGMTMFELALSWKHEDQTKYAKYLSLAAISDIKGGISDGFALPTLADWLYKEKSYQKAFQYINYAIGDANKGNARMRLVMIASYVPNIDEAYRDEISSSLADYILYAALTSAILIILVIILALLLREMKRRRQAHTHLASLSKMKDEYIRDFISLCSAYAEKYDSLSRTVVRKITAGQSQELLKIIKTGKASENENEDFYRTIDHAFLTLYPNFIQNINQLLEEDQRFDVEKNSDTLNPELRIYAFVRLGLTESAKIAKILNYSANTVYSYRNRMRNKAIDREKFDENVMKLDESEDGE